MTATQKETKMKKYYFISSMYRYQEINEFRPMQEVSDEHPFQVMAHYEISQPHTEIVLISWQGITKEEFELYEILNA
jgi:hypothetical protein